MLPAYYSVIVIMCKISSSWQEHVTFQLAFVFALTKAYFYFTVCACVQRYPVSANHARWLQVPSVGRRFRLAPLAVPANLDCRLHGLEDQYSKRWEHDLVAGNWLQILVQMQRVDCVNFHFLAMKFDTLEMLDKTLKKLHALRHILQWLYNPLCFSFMKNMLF